MWGGADFLTRRVGVVSGLFVGFIKMWLALENPPLTQKDNIENNVIQLLKE